MNAQDKVVRGPVKAGQMHSSGKVTAEIGGKNFYLNGGIPGEEIRFVSGKRKGKAGFRNGEITEIVEASPFRTEPFCRHHDSCNGCNWQHIDYPHQLELKRRILLQALEKYGIEVPLIPAVIPSPSVTRYRHRTEYAFAARNNAFGFHNGEAGEVSDITECHLQPEPSGSICRFVRKYIRIENPGLYDHGQKTGFLRSFSMRISSTGEIVVIAGFGEDDPFKRNSFLHSLQSNFPAITSLNWTIHESPRHSQLQGTIHTFGNNVPYFLEKSGNLDFRVHAISFYQPNAAQATSIFSTVREWADLKGNELVYDLYTGVGTIALYLARSAKKVIGIEGSAQAIDDATENACINGIDNAEFLTGDILETFRPEFVEKHGIPDVIVLDPPRSGTLIEIKKTINGSGAAKVIYLSCNPVSLAFDLKQLTEVYEVTKIQPFDMLPHTHHLETLVLMSKK
jgi:23S rRNA (uracil1939-C5)-methyltransferase